MVNLTVKCKNLEIDMIGEVRLLDVTNIDEIAIELAEQCDPGLLVTEKNQDLFLDAIGMERIREYLRER